MGQTHREAARGTRRGAAGQRGPPGRGAHKRVGRKGNHTREADMPRNGRQACGGNTARMNTHEQMGRNTRNEAERQTGRRGRRADGKEPKGTKWQTSQLAARQPGNGSKEGRHTGDVVANAGGNNARRHVGKATQGRGTQCRAGTTARRKAERNKGER